MTANSEYIVCVVNSGQMYLSSNSGATVSNPIPNKIQVYTSVAISSTGQYISTCVSGGFIWYSTNFGLSFDSYTQYTDYFYGIDVSSDGRFQVASAVNLYNNGGGFVYYSNNYGLNWLTVAGFQSYYYDISVSNDGTHITFTSQGGFIYYSSNFGALNAPYAPTFAASPSYYGLNFYGVALSNNGQYQIVSYLNGGILFSTTYGVSFTSSISTGTTIYSVSIDPSGINSYFITYGGGLYYSNNYGSSFTQEVNVPNGNYRVVFSQDDSGTCVLYTADGGGVYDTCYGYFKSISPTFQPSLDPSSNPSEYFSPSSSPSVIVSNSKSPTYFPSNIRSLTPTTSPSSLKPSSNKPSSSVTVSPSAIPTSDPTNDPTKTPTNTPISAPTAQVSIAFKMTNIIMLSFILAYCNADIISYSGTNKRTNFRADIESIILSAYNRWKDYCNLIANVNCVTLFDYAVNI